MGLCVATGLPILGQLQTEKSEVLWIDGELGLRKYRDNYCRKVISGAPELLPEPGQFRARSYFGDSDIPDFTRPDDLDHVASLMDGRQLCIIDCLRRFYTGDENARRGADILIKLGGISARTGCAIIIIHHHRKPAGMAAATESSRCAARLRSLTWPTASTASPETRTRS
ncbi:MAG: AAA family ATPase [Myxococcales bacterium]|nr:AAA family ATPase [Myxococcales bacterium]